MEEILAKISGWDLQSAQRMDPRLFVASVHEKGGETDLLAMSAIAVREPRPWRTMMQMSLEWFCS